MAQQDENQSAVCMHVWTNKPNNDYQSLKQKLTRKGGKKHFFDAGLGSMSTIRAIDQGVIV